MAAWLKLPEVRTFLRMQTDPTEDTVIDTARQAAIDYGMSKYAGRYDVDSVDVPGQRTRGLFDSFGPPVPPSGFHRRDDFVGGHGRHTRGPRGPGHRRRCTPYTAPLVFG